MPMPDTPQSIAVIAFDGINPFHLTVPGLIFGKDRTLHGVPLFDYRICSCDGPVIDADNGLRIEIPFGLDAADTADVIIVPSWRDPAEMPPEPLLACLRRTMDRGAMVVGLCLGAFPLAAAGCLKGRRATTHWGAVDQLRTMSGAAEIAPDVLYVDEGQVVTSAGVSAGLDCCLHLLRRFRGAEIARIVARHTVLAPHRQGGQAQFIEQAIPLQPELDRFDAALASARADLRAAPGLDALAAQAGLTRRTFSRHFRQRYGTSFYAWLGRERIAAAQRLLETTDLTVERIAGEVGFGTATAFRQRFVATLGVTPTGYRRAFAEALA